MKKDTRQQQIFLDLADRYQGVIAKVCSIYAGPGMAFEDLYQEVMLNLWRGVATYRGDAKMSTWIYRLAINSCISFHRSQRKHLGSNVPIEQGFDVPDASPMVCDDDLALLYRAISHLDPIDKALVTLWLEEKSYDDIASIIGITRTNVATRLSRAKQRLSDIVQRLQ